MGGDIDTIGVSLVLPSGGHAQCRVVDIGRADRLLLVECDDIEKLDDIHWKTRRALLADIDRLTKQRDDAYAVIDQQRAALDGVRDLLSNLGGILQKTSTAASFRVLAARTDPELKASIAAAAAKEPGDE